MKLKAKLSRYTISAIVVWAICAVLTGAGYCLFYAPQTAEVTRLKHQSNQLQDELNQAQMAAKPDTREKIQLQFEEKMNMIRRFSTKADASTELVFQIGQIASELDLGDFSSKQENKPSHPTVKDALEEAWLKIEFVATFEQFAQFINRLERNSPVVFVEKVFLRRSSADENGLDVSLFLSFLTEKEQKTKSVAMAN